jgi:hypothetical protein
MAVGNVQRRRLRLRRGHAQSPWLDLSSFELYVWFSFAVA